MAFTIIPGHIILREDLKINDKSSFVLTINFAETVNSLWLFICFNSFVLFLILYLLTQTAAAETGLWILTDYDKK